MSKANIGAYKSNGGYSVYYASNIFCNTRDLPACHTPITSKVVNWLQFTSRLSNRLRFSWKNMLWRKSSLKRLPAGVNRMFHMADVRCAGEVWRSRILGSHLKSGFLHELIFLDFIRALSLSLTWRRVKLATRYIVSLKYAFCCSQGKLLFVENFNVSRYQYWFVFCNGNRTEWSPIRSVIIQVITKSDDRAAGVRFVYHEYDYRPNWTTRSLITN